MSGNPKARQSLLPVEGRGLEAVKANHFLNGENVMVNSSVTFEDFEPARLYVFEEQSIGTLDAMTNTYSAITGLATKGWGGPLEGVKSTFGASIRPAKKSDLDVFRLADSRHYKTDEG